MFSYGSSSSISFATVTPSLVTVGEPNFLSRTTLRPFGPRVAVTARESLVTPRRIACRAASSNNSCFAAIIFYLVSGLRVDGYELVNDREEVVGAKNLVLLAVQFDFRAAVFADEHAVTLLDFKGHFFAVVIGFARAERDN